MTIREDKINVVPMDVFWGRRQKQTITFVDDTASDQAGKFFTIGDDDYFWLDDSIAADPVPVGFANGNAIVYAPGDTGVVIAALAAAVVTAVTGFNAKAAAAIMTYEEGISGPITGLVDGDTGYVIVDVTIGDGRDLGATQGGLETSFSQDLTDIVADQSGSQIIDQVVTATNLELSMTLQELDKPQWDLILGEVLGEKQTIDGKDVVTLGDSKRFKNMSLFARELRLKPVGSSDDEDNFTFWKAYPIIDSVTFNGTDPATMTLTWRMLRDPDKTNKDNLFLRGDGSVNLLP